MISYAQNCEDVLLSRFFKGDSPQCYVDVGAGHPIFHSVTKHFYEAGWQGINIEPREQLWRQLQQERPRDTNLCCAVSDQPTILTFHEVTVPSDMSDDPSGISTLDAELAAAYQRAGYKVCSQTVANRRLTEILTEYNINEIGFLKIDVEGFELSVMRSLDWNRWRPRVVIAECTIPMSGEICDSQSRSFLGQNGYMEAFFDGLNRYYVRFEDAGRIQRLCTPANVLDCYETQEAHQLKLRVSELSEQVQFLEEKLAQVNVPLSSKDQEASHRQLVEQVHWLKTELSIQQAKARRRTLRGRWKQARQVVQELVRSVNVAAKLDHLAMWNKH